MVIGDGREDLTVAMIRTKSSQPGLLIAQYLLASRSPTKSNAKAIKGICTARSCAFLVGALTSFGVREVEFLGATSIDRTNTKRQRS